MCVKSLNSLVELVFKAQAVRLDAQGIAWSTVDAKPDWLGGSSCIAEMLAFMLCAGGLRRSCH
jgi:hypothetical protein